MRRRLAEARENHDRWLVSYADFITLLFALFVVMFASAQSHQLKEVSDSVKNALEHGRLRAGGSAATAVDKPASPAGLERSLADLQQGLDQEIRSGKIGLKLEGRGLVISLREATFFASGDDSVAPGSIPILAKIATEIQAIGNPVRLEGHTDSVPIHNSRFRSNWELSAARSIAMLELLHQNFGIAAERLSAAGYAANAPVESNDTEEGRARNRRVDLVILSDQAVKVEPGRN